MNLAVFRGRLSGCTAITEIKKGEPPQGGRHSPVNGITGFWCFPCLDAPD